jgi:transposase
MEERTEQKCEDARRLPLDALERVRRQAVAAVDSGLPQKEVAERFGVSRRSVGEWVRAYRARGEESFRPAQRGRRLGEKLALCAARQDRILRIVVTDPPDRLGLPCRLWTRRAVAELIYREFGISLSTATVARYLVRWGIDTVTYPAGSMHPARAPTVRAPAAARAIPEDVVQLSWAWPHLVTAQHPAYALLALTSTDVLHFLAHDQPFGVEALEDLRGRLRMQLARDVQLVAGPWPPEHLELLSNWTSATELERRP